MKQEVIERLIADAQTKEEVIAAIAPDALTAREQALFMAAVIFSTRKTKVAPIDSANDAEFNHDADTLSEAVGVDMTKFMPKFEDVFSTLEMEKLKFEQQVRRIKHNDDIEDKESAAKEAKRNFKLNKSHVFELIINSFDSDVERMLATTMLSETPYL